MENSSRTNISGEMIDLAKGHPNLKHLPSAEVTSAFEKSLSSDGDGAALLQYGPMQGAKELRIAICEWLRDKACRKSITPEEILITNGSGHGLALCCQLYSKPGDTIFVETPAYFLSYYTFHDCGLKVVEIPNDENGLDVSEVEKRLHAGERPKLLYTVPIANNPCGTTLTKERRERLVELGREFNFKILSDEVYQFLQWKDTHESQGLYDLDNSEHPIVFGLQSFSKILGPGVRVGWIETNKKHIIRLLDSGALQSGGGFNPLASGMVLQLMRNGFLQNHVEMLRKKYALCCSTMCNALDKHLGDSITYERPLGGFFCFITIQKSINTVELLQSCLADFNVKFFPGYRFCEDGSKFNNAFRLCFAYNEPNDIEIGVERLAMAIRACFQKC